jgi:hypothetical protein
MNRTGWLLIAAAGAFTILLAFVCFNRTIPLGIPGEWTWNRQPNIPLFSFLPVMIAAAVFMAVCVVCWRWAERNNRRAPFALLLAMLAAVPFHWSLFFTPPAPMGAERWLLSLSNPSSSGYFSVANDLRRPTVKHPSWNALPTSEFLADYESWIATQDSFHIGTHPPGLFLAYRGLFNLMDQDRKIPEHVLWWSPSRMLDAILALQPAVSLSPVEYSVLIAAALSTWLAFWLSTPFVYLLSRLSSSPSASLAASCFWLAMPGPLLFMPLADVAYVLPSAIVAWLLVAGASSVPVIAATTGIAAGVVFFGAVNMSLAFLVVLMFAGLAGLFRDVQSWRRPASWVAWIAFTAAVAALLVAAYLDFGLNLLAVFKINLEKHRGFYEHFPRSYWPWVGMNLLEFAATIGVFAVLLPAACISRASSIGRRTALAFVVTLVVLDLTGKNLSEAARLWLFLTPLAAASASSALEGGMLTAERFGWLLFFQCAAATILHASVEPLLPIAVAK